MGHGFNPGAAAAIARHPNCSLAQIRVAEQRLQFEELAGRLRKTPQAFLRAAIERKYQPPPDDATIAFERLPEHDADDAGAELLRQRAAAAEERLVTEYLARASDEWVNVKMQELIRAAKSDFDRTALMKMAKNNPRQCASLRDLVRPAVRREAEQRRRAAPAVAASSNTDAPRGTVEPMAQGEGAKHP
jgi:hypothetical protein